MRLRSILIALSALLRFGVAACDVGPQPGIGISLSSGYAAVSALLPNGSYIDIAQILGGAEYKAYMLGSKEELKNIVSAKYCPFSQRMCQYWPFRGVETRNPLASEVKALVVAAISESNTTIQFAAVSVYDTGTINHELTKNHVQRALKDMGVDGYNRLDHVARQLAPALGIRGNCSEPYTLPDDPSYHHDPAQNIFTIEYTHNSLTAGLWTEECGVMGMAKRLNSAKLGHKAMQTCRETAKNRTACEEAFKSALLGVAEDSRRDKHEEIGPVLIFGECADDDAMLTTLREVLEEQFPNGDSVDLSRVLKISPDPIYAGSRSMAKADWEARGSEYEDHHKDEL